MRRPARAKAVKRSSYELGRSVCPYRACLFSRLAVCALLETSALHCSNPITAHILHHVALALRAPLAHHTCTPARAAAALYSLTRLIYLLMFPDVLSCAERACREGSRLGLQVAARPVSSAGAPVEHGLCGRFRLATRPQRRIRGPHGVRTPRAECTTTTVLHSEAV